MYISSQFRENVKIDNNPDVANKTIIFLPISTHTNFIKQKTQLKLTRGRV